MKPKIILGIVAVVAIVVGIIVLTQIKGSKPKGIDSGKIKVITTLFPLYDMAKGIGANKAEVSLLLPPGVEPHTFEPKPSDIVRITEADVFVFTGKSMEPWAEDILKGVAVS